MSMKSCPCVVCNGSGFASDSFMPRKISKMNRKGQWKVLYQRINCGACNGSGVQVEDSYLDNMIRMNSSNVRKESADEHGTKNEEALYCQESMIRGDNEKKVRPPRSKKERRSSVERRDSMERRTSQLERWIKEKYVSEKCLRLFS